MTHLSVITNPNAARDDADHIIVVPPEDRVIVVPPRTPDDCLIALSDGSRWWVSLPPDVRALLPRSLSRRHKALGSHFGCDVFDLSFPLKQRRRQRKPDGLLTRVQAATKLNCSLRTFDGHIASGTLRYVVIGHGKKRPRRMFTDADLNEFIANQTRKDVPCPSTAPRARHSGNSTSSGEVIAFTDRRNARTGGKRKR